eukprot:7278200-Heterocapsa_arctica.AAC.1
MALASPRATSTFLSPSSGRILIRRLALALALRQLPAQAYCSQWTGFEFGILQPSGHLPAPATSARWNFSLLAQPQQFEPFAHEHAAQALAYAVNTTQVVTTFDSSEGLTLPLENCI